MNEQSGEFPKAESGERKAGPGDTKSTAAAAAFSPFRPMSDEERAELEAVYQDRGCGVECDPDCGPLVPRAETTPKPTDGKDMD